MVAGTDGSSQFLSRRERRIALRSELFLARQLLGDNKTYAENGSDRISHCRSAKLNSELPAATATYCRPSTE